LAHVLKTARVGFYCRK